MQIDLSSVAKLVSDQLQSTGIDLFAQIPAADIGGKITLFQSNDLYKARRAVGILNTLAYVLPLLVFGAVRRGHLPLPQPAPRLRARGRSRSPSVHSCSHSSSSWRAACIWTRRRTTDFPYDAAAAVYDTLVRFLDTAVRAVLTFSIVVLITVFFAGPSRFAIWFRARVRWTADWLGSESEHAGWDWLAPNGFVVRHKRMLRIDHGRARVPVAGASRVIRRRSDHRDRHRHARRPRHHRVLRPRTCNRRGADPALRPADHHDDITVGLSSAELA